jgi:tetratricopeptide (TPR) repeat protein
MRSAIVAVVFLFATSLPAQLSQATSLYEQARYDEAKRLLASMPNDADALLILGKIGVVQEDDQASQLLERAAKLKPTRADIHYWLGTAYRTEMMHASFFRQPSLASKMREQFEEALRLDGNYHEARIALIDYFIFAPAIAGGSEEKALQQAAEVKKRDRFAGHRAYVRLYTRQKKVDLARKEYLDAVREDPNSPLARATLAGFYAGTDKNYAQAFVEADAALKLDPSYMPAWFRVGQAAALSGTNLPRGEEALKKYLTYRPAESEPGILSTYYYLGSIYEKAGKRVEARAAYATALRITPKWKQLQDAAERVK